jgi:hypothetical protein
MVSKISKASVSKASENQSKPEKKTVKKPDSLSPEENFVWTVCARMADSGQEAEPAYESVGEDPFGKLLGIRCDDGTIVPLDITIRAARPFVSVNGIRVLNGAAVSPRTLDRVAESVLAEQPGVARAQRKREQENKFSEDLKDVQTVVEKFGWKINSYWQVTHLHDEEKLRLSFQQDVPASLNQLRPLLAEEFHERLAHLTADFQSQLKTLLNDCKEEAARSATQAASVK